MTKKTSLILLCGYEVVRIYLILTTWPDTVIPLLPFSWYASLPLTLIPILTILYQLFTVTKNDNSDFFTFFYSLTKTLSCVGFIVYILSSLKNLQSHARLIEFYSLRQLAMIVLFLLIDVIIIVSSICSKEKRTDNYADNSSS